MRIALGVVSVCGVAMAQETTVSLSPSKDNTLYQLQFGETAVSNGAGAHWFVGRTAQNRIRRGLMAFNLSSIPAEASILAVQLRITCSRSAVAGQENITIHRVLANWGEGGSNAPSQEGEGATAQANDATWFSRFHPSTAWQNTGGTFVATPSLTKPTNQPGEYVLESDGLVADVQQWVDNPATNFGWIFRGNETTASTAKRFDSKENSVESARPLLTVTYTLGPVCDSIDFNNDNGFFDPQDIDAFLSVYSEGPCVPATATCNDIDFNNDGSVFDPRDIDAFYSVFSEGPCL